MRLKGISQDGLKRIGRIVSQKETKEELVEQMYGTFEQWANETLEEWDEEWGDPPPKEELIETIKQRFLRGLPK